MDEWQKDRLIIHCDLNNFYASVECILRPELKTVPLAVSGDPEKRHGIILAKNDPAKALGVKTAETIWEARKKAPDLVLVPPHFDLYMQYSRRITQLYTLFTPLVESFGPDECWLDVTGCTRLSGNGRAIADEIRATVKKETGLTLSAGVSFNKVFAKLGSDLKKPDATTVITRTNFRNVLWPLDVSDMMMVGKSTAQKLRRCNIRTIGDLAQADPAFLQSLLGSNGRKLVEDARGENRDPVREVEKNRELKSIGHGMTTTRDVFTYEDAKPVLYFLSDRIAERMRKHGVRGGTISVDLRFSDLTHISRQMQLTRSTCAAAEIAVAAMRLLQNNWKERSAGIRTLTVSLSALSRDAYEQTDMFDDRSHEKAEKLERAMDAIRKKYGARAIERANLAGNDFLYDKTDDEDFLPFRR